MIEHIVPRYIAVRAEYDYLIVDLAHKVGGGDIERTVIQTDLDYRHAHLLEKSLNEEEDRRIQQVAQRES